VIRSKSRLAYPNSLFIFGDEVVELKLHFQELPQEFYLPSLSVHFPPLALPMSGGLGRVDSFKLSTADFESINLNKNSQVYLFLIKRVSDNN
jgi:hypothetical protein